MALAPDRLSATVRSGHRVANGRIGLRRLFTSPGVDPYDEVVWERRDARITNWKDGTVAFEQLDVEFPTTWSLNATNIVAQKYFRGTLGTPERESSLRQVVDRVVDTITTWGREGGYFADDDEARGVRGASSSTSSSRSGRRSTARCGSTSASRACRSRRAPASSCRSTTR